MLDDWGIMKGKMEGRKEREEEMEESRKESFIQQTFCKQLLRAILCFNIKMKRQSLPYFCYLFLLIAGIAHPYF